MGCKFMGVALFDGDGDVWSQQRCKSKWVFFQKTNQT